MRIEITEKELAVRKSTGVVYVCKPCMDLRKKIVLINHVQSGRKEILYGICTECQKLMSGCQSCSQSR